MADGFTLETITQYVNYANDELKINTTEGLKGYILSRLPVPTEKQEELRAAFDEILPNQNVIFPGQEEMRQRRLEHANAYNTYIHLAAEYGSIDRAKGTRRDMGTLYKLEQDQDAVKYNNHLRETIEKKDYMELGRLYGEHIMNLPSCDLEMLENVSNLDAPGVLRELYPLYTAVMEAKKFLDETGEDVAAIKEGMSEESKARLAELVQYMDAFTKLKVRCDDMFSPYYPYIDTSKVPCTQENLDALAVTTPVGMSESLQRAFPALGSTLLFTANAFNDDVRLLLEKANMDPEQTVVRDFCGRTHPLAYATDDCISVFKRGEPVFCISGNRLKAFHTDGREVVEVQPKEAMEYCLKNVLPAAVENTDNILNGDVAAPRWMITGSSQYKGMQKAYANYQKAVKGRPGAAELEDPTALNALKALEPAAEAYFQYKGVNLEKYPDFDTFYRNADMAQDMSRRELTRMAAAYNILDTSRTAAGALDMQPMLLSYPEYSAPLPRKVPYGQRVQQTNEAILTSPFLTEPVPPAGSNNAAENLRQDINKALSDPKNGLLNKKFFTVQDRQAAEKVLAQAVILDMVRSGRKVTNTSPVGIETAYQGTPKETIEIIRKSDAFQKAAKNGLTPDGLRNFLANNRQAGVNKSIATSVAQQYTAANAQVQVQPEMQMQLTQPQAELSKAAAPSMGGAGGLS